MSCGKLHGIIPNSIRISVFGWYNTYMHYFANRAAAGNLIADKLEPKYRYEDCAVLALSDGAVLVGAEIAKRLHCVINMLLSSDITLPRETDVLATIDNFGGLTYNTKFSAGELEELRTEHFNYIEQQKLEKIFEMNELLGDGGVLNPSQLRNRNVIVVADGLLNGFSMRAAADFLKPIKLEKLIMVAPFASVAAVDQMHVLADELVCLDVVENIISIDHYYEDSALPEHETIIRVLEDIVLHWK
jgi:putative phosphoribosyl transferase